MSAANWNAQFASGGTHLDSCEGPYFGGRASQSLIKKSEAVVQQKSGLGTLPSPLEFSDRSLFLISGYACLP